MQLIRSRCDLFFLCKVMVNSTDAYGKKKRVLNQYLIDAKSWAEAEFRILQHLNPFIDGPQDLQDISIGRYDEVFFTEGYDGMLWFSAKLDYRWIDEWTGKEKHSTRMFLVPAEDLDKANKLIDDILGDTKEEYFKSEVKDSGICEVIEHTEENGN